MFQAEDFKIYVRVFTFHSFLSRTRRSILSSDCLMRKSWVLRDYQETAERRLRNRWKTAERPLRDCLETAERLLRDCLKFWTRITKIEWRIQHYHTRTHRQTHRVTSWAPVRAKNSRILLLDISRLYSLFPKLIMPPGMTKYKVHTCSWLPLFGLYFKHVVLSLKLLLIELHSSSFDVLQTASCIKSD